MIENLGNIHGKFEKVNIEIQHILEREDFKEAMIVTDMGECEKYTMRWLEIKSEMTSSAGSHKGTYI